MRSEGNQWLGAEGRKGIKETRKKRETRETRKLLILNARLLAFDFISSL
jgi:hypothetical protein